MVRTPGGICTVVWKPLGCFCLVAGGLYVVAVTHASICAFVMVDHLKYS